MQLTMISYYSVITDNDFTCHHYIAERLAVKPTLASLPLLTTSWHMIVQFIMSTACLLVILNWERFRRSDVNYQRVLDTGGADSVTSLTRDGGNTSGNPRSTRREACCGVDVGPRSQCRNDACHHRVLTTH